MIECDVLIVGGGIAGAGVAAEISSQRSVIVLEQEDHPGMHATGRSAAMHSEIYGNEHVRALSRASRPYFFEGAEGRPFATERGFLHIAAAHQLERLEAFLKEPGVAPAVERVSGAQARDRVPVLRSDYVVTALAERFAYDLDVDAIHRAFLRRLRGNGGQLRCASRLSRCDFDGKFWSVAAGDGVFRAPILVDAAGAWGDEVALLAGVRPIGLRPLRRSALIVDAPSDPSRWPAVLDIDEQFYFKPEAGKILMSPADETMSAPCDASPDVVDLAIAVDRVQQAANIPVQRISHSWAGLRTFAPDKTPVVGFDPRNPAFFWLVGQGGYGIQSSPALSRMAAALLDNQPLPSDLIAEGVDPVALAPARFRHDNTLTPIGSQSQTP